MEDDVLPENSLEVEKNLQTLAMRNNLDDASVKKILKVSFYLIIVMILEYII